MQLKIERLKITDNEKNIITRNEILTLYDNIYNVEVSDDTANKSKN